MSPITLFSGLAVVLLSSNVAQAQSAEANGARRIVLVAGVTAKVDVPGHHDYLAGCQCLEKLLGQTAGVETVRVQEGWPQDERVFEQADSVVFYTDGGGKQEFLKSPERVAVIQSLADSGVGIVMIHQAVDFPDEFAEQAKSWLGGIYLNGKSGRGHWPSSHVDFPKHEVTHGVTPWEINDGWLNGLQFVDGKQGVTPLVWSSKDYPESPTQDANIVSWVFERPKGGRSFSFSGLDAHSAWELEGMRRFVVNGILWSAHVKVPEPGADCAIEKRELDSMLTPREEKKKPAEKKK